MAQSYIPLNQTDSRTLSNAYLKMKDDSLAIKHQRGEVEDDNDELKEKLNGLYLRIIEAKKQDSIYPDSKNQTVMNHRLS